MELALVGASDGRGVAVNRHGVCSCETEALEQIMLDAGRGWKYASRSNDEGSDMKTANNSSYCRSSSTGLISILTARMKKDCQVREGDVTSPHYITVVGNTQDEDRFSIERTIEYQDFQPWTYGLVQKTGE